VKQSSVPQEFSKAKPPKGKQSARAQLIDSDEEIILRKQSSEFFVNMIEAGEHAKTTFFFVGPEKKAVKTIKGVMMDVSPKLNELVLSNDTVELPELTFEGFQAMLQFIYSKEYSWSRETLVPTMACAIKFGLKHLYRECFEWLEVNIQPEDAIKVLDDCMTHAKVLGNVEKHNIEKAAWDIILSDGKEGELALAKIFASHDAEWVKNVLKGNSLVCSEEIMFNAVANWACEQANKKFPDEKTIYPQDWRLNIEDEKSSAGKDKNKQEVLKHMMNMVQYIRFPMIPAQCITTNGLIAEVLQPLEMIEVLRYQHDPNSSKTKFQCGPRYKTKEISQQGCCAQSSEHFATLDYDAKLIKFDTGEGDYPIRIAANLMGKVLGAELALTRCLFKSERIVEGPEGLDVAQTKLDYQPWWDLDLGRLCRIHKIQVLLGAPGRIPGRRQRKQNEDENDMFPLVLCLARDSFPDMEGTLTDSIQMSVNTKTFVTAPSGTPVQLEWEPELVAARTFRIQCEKAALLRIMKVRIFSAEPLMSELPQIFRVQQTSV